MGSKEEYEARKAARQARREHLDDYEQRQIDQEEQMDRLVTAFERIADALSGIEMNTRKGVQR